MARPRLRRERPGTTPPHGTRPARTGEAKTHARDALIIAAAARWMPRALRSLRLPDERVTQLTMLCDFDDDLAQQVIPTSNRPADC